MEESDAEHDVISWLSHVVLCLLKMLAKEVPQLSSIPIVATSASTDSRRSCNQVTGLVLRLSSLRRVSLKGATVVVVESLNTFVSKLDDGIGEQ